MNKQQHTPEQQAQILLNNLRPFIKDKNFGPDEILSMLAKPIADLLKERDGYRAQVESLQDQLLRADEEIAKVKEEHHKSLVFISNLGLVKCELLEALKKSRSLLLSQFGLFGGGTPLNRTIDLMNATIAKAEGKEG
jgi:hypothetical protein